MSVLRLLFASALLMVVTIAVHPAAFAQTAAVIVVDQARVMRDSKAGQDLVKKVNAIGDQMAKELEPEAKALETEEKSLNAKATGLTPEAIMQNPQLKQQAESFARRLGEFRNKRNKRAAELQATERQAWGKFNESLRPVLQEVINERGATVLLDRSQVIYSAETVDVTQSVIAKLDGRAPTIQVSRVNLPDQSATRTQ